MLAAGDEFRLLNSQEISSSYELDTKVALETVSNLEKFRNFHILLRPKGSPMVMKIPIFQLKQPTRDQISREIGNLVSLGAFKFDSIQARCDNRETSSNFSLNEK